MRNGNVKTILRLAEIDAPERTQPYSQVSRRNLIALCKDKPIEFNQVSIDRFGRTVAMVTCDGVLVNWRQVQDGLAWCFMKYLTQPKACLPLEREARDARRGLWLDDQPVPPCEWRRAISRRQTLQTFQSLVPARQQLLDFSLVRPVGANLASLNLASLRMNQTWGSTMTSNSLLARAAAVVSLVLLVLSSMIALQFMGTQTLAFDEAIANPVFAFVSLNRNGYAFDQDFEILSVGSQASKK